VPFGATRVGIGRDSEKGGGEGEGVVRVGGV